MTRCNTICQRTCEAALSCVSYAAGQGASWIDLRCKGRRRQEQATAKAEFRSKIEEGQHICQSRNTRLRRSQKESQYHLTSPRLGSGLASRDYTPAKNHPSRHVARRYDLEQNILPFEENIWNIEYREQPLVSIANQIEVVLHSCYFRISAWLISKSESFVALYSKHTRCLIDQEKTAGIWRTLDLEGSNPVFSRSFAQ